MRAEHDVSVRDAQQQSAEADAVEPGHPLRGWMAAQREVMARLDAFLASPAIPTDAVDALDRRIATDEVERLRAVLAEQAAVAAARGARAAGGRRISVRDFGAAGDGRRDDGPPLRAAVAALAAAGPGTTLHIPAGMYRLSGFADPRRRYALVLRDLAHVTIDADPGTTLVSSEVGGVLLAVGCRDVHVRNLALDHDPLPTTQGVVEAAEVVPGDARAVTAGDMTGTGADADNLLALTWRLDDGHTPPDAPPISLVNAANGNAYDATTGEPLGGHGGFALRRVERLDARRFRLVGAVGGRAADELRAGHVPSLYAPGTRLGLRTRGIDGGRCAL
ncbi:MAG TPA: hypothetical protein VK324_00340, partial [Tepidisphaeraceae bacterium]|nr:hypothetical protein [Tepidisphaeraceae bacterium]